MTIFDVALLPADAKADSIIRAYLRGNPKRWKYMTYPTLLELMKHDQKTIFLVMEDVRKILVRWMRK